MNEDTFHQRVETALNVLRIVGMFFGTIFLLVFMRWFYIIGSSEKIENEHRLLELNERRKSGQSR